MADLAALRDKIRRLREAPAACKPVLRQQCEELLEEARALCPVDTGELAGSGHLEETAEGFDLVFDAPYAAAVHENLETAHTSGQAKFLEQPSAQGRDTRREGLLQALQEEIRRG